MTLNNLIGKNLEQIKGGSGNDASYERPATTAATASAEAAPTLDSFDDDIPF